MIKTVRDAWKIPELRKKILFTIFALLIFRLGAAIPVPYINSQELEVYLAAQSGTILGLMNAMSGSAFSMATLFALSIQPYGGAACPVGRDRDRPVLHRRFRLPDVAG